MKIFNLPKNTYQYIIALKFNCIPTDAITETVQKLLVEERLFSNVSRDETTKEAILDRGAGTERDPAFQIRIGQDRVVIWAGWFVPFPQWQEWRESTFLKILPQLSEWIHVDFVGFLSSQSVITIPVEKLRLAHEIEELTPMLNFYRRFIPDRLLKRANAYLVFADEEVKESVEWWVGGSKSPTDENVTLNFRKNLLDRGISIQQNVADHFANSDKLLLDFHSGFLSLVVKE